MILKDIEDTSVRARVSQMMDMNAIMCSVNNEDYSDEWQSIGIPDGCDLEMYVEIAEDDDSYRAIAREFLRICTSLYATGNIHDFAYVRED